MRSVSDQRERVGFKQPGPLFALREEKLDTGFALYIPIAQFGEEPDSHVSHTVLDPMHIRLDQGENGEHEALQIEAPGQAVTLVRFRSPVSPDLVADVIIE